VKEFTLRTLALQSPAAYLGSVQTRSSDLKIAFLLHVPLSAHSRLNWHDISVLFKRTPNLEPTLWRTGRVSHGEYKNTSIPLQFPHPGKFHDHWVRQVPSQYYNSHHVGGFSLMWTQNIPHWEKGVVIPGFCVPNFKKPCKRTHWLARTSKGLH
jgi:hypothetical protein